MIIDFDGDFVPDRGTIYGSEATVTYSFDGYGEIASLEAFFDDNVNVNGKFASCEAYNADRGCFEPVFEASNDISGPPMCTLPTISMKEKPAFFLTLRGK